MNNLGYHEIRRIAKFVDYYFTEGFWYEVYDTPTAIYAAMWTDSSTNELPMTIKVGHKCKSTN